MGDDEEPPEEPNPRTSAKWRGGVPLSLKYVDDGMTIEKINFETAPYTSPATKEKHAVRSQNIFRSVVSKAQSMGMKVNTSKTNLLVVSDAASFTLLPIFSTRTTSGLIRPEQ